MSGDYAPPEYGEVDLARHGIRSYLVKMPDFLLEEFENDSRPVGSIVGRLRIPEPDSMAPNANPEEREDETAPRIYVDNPVDPNNLNPREFKLSFPDEPADIVLMSWKPKGDDPSMRVEGRIAYQCDARPPLNAAYRNINRRRVADEEDKYRETVHMDEGERIRAQNKAVRVTALAETVTQKEERTKKSLKARKHLDVPGEEYKVAIKTAVFRAFEGRLHYGAEELSKDIDEPLQTLRRVLNEVCMYNKAGPFSGKYELRDEFKTVAQREQKKQELEDHRLATIEDVKRRREERAQNEREKAEPAMKKTRFN
jgi:transcription initiation factor TFIIF subunit beta